MRPSVLLALASGLLAHALPTTPTTSLNAVNTRRQYTPDLPIPGGTSCPAVPGPNPYSNNPTKRSLTTATHLRRQNELCKQIASTPVNHFRTGLYTTVDILLIQGATYVFSWGLNEIITQVRAMARNADGSYRAMQNSSPNFGAGTMTLTNAEPLNVHFEIQFDDMNPYEVYDVSGEVALFQTANGDQNP